MNKYEVLYILENELSEESKKALVEKFSNTILSLNGEVVSVEPWGTKRYAYPINFKSEGYYVLMNFESEGSAVEELERQMRITDGVVRQMVVRKE